MRKIRYLTVLVMALLMTTPMLGQDIFNPVDPDEPGAPPVPLVLKADPVAGGSVSGAGKIVPGQTVTVRASGNANFRFVNWTDGDGNVKSATASYTFVKGYDEETLVAHFEFVPNGPDEPVPGEQLVYNRLTVVADVGGTVSGGGRYRGGTQVTLTANCETNFVFRDWTNEKGEVVSTERSFKYTTQYHAETLTAHFLYNPGSPDEPGDPILRRKVNVVCTEGGTIGNYSQTVFTGNSFTLYAYPNSGYDFIGWYLGGELYTTLASFSCTMGNEHMEFEARFAFNPDSPDEPAMPTDKQYAFYLMSEITYPGTRIDCPVYLTSLSPLCDMTFQLTFTDEVKPDWTSLELDAKAQGYAVSVSETDSVGVWLLSLIGGEVASGNTRLLNIKADVPEDVAFGASYQVKINQVSVAQTDGSTVTASTRNGRVYVYKLGDTNGDGLVDITDKMNVVLNVLGESPEGFIPEVSDVNEDGSIDISDAMGVVNILLNE